MKFLSFLCIKWMENCEAMTSSTHSFAYIYSYRLVKKCFLKNCETSKCHNFLIFQPIFIRFSVFCSKCFTLFSEIKLNLVWISSLTTGTSCLHSQLFAMLEWLCPCYWKSFPQVWTGGKKIDFWIAIEISSNLLLWTALMMCQYIVETAYTCLHEHVKECIFNLHNYFLINICQLYVFNNLTM